MSIPAFRNGWPLALVTAAILATAVASAQQLPGGDPSPGPDPSPYSIAPEGALGADEPEDPDLPDGPFGAPPDPSVREPEFGDEETSPPRERRFHLEMED